MAKVQEARGASQARAQWHATSGLCICSAGNGKTDHGIKAGSNRLSGEGGLHSSACYRRALIKGKIEKRSLKVLSYLDHPTMRTSIMESKHNLWCTPNVWLPLAFHPDLGQLSPLSSVLTVYSVVLCGPFYDQCAVHLGLNRLKCAQEDMSCILFWDTDTIWWWGFQSGMLADLFYAVCHLLHPQGSHVYDTGLKSHSTISKWNISNNFKKLSTKNPIKFYRRK